MITRFDSLRTWTASIAAGCLISLGLVSSSLAAAPSELNKMQLNCTFKPSGSSDGTKIALLKDTSNNDKKTAFMKRDGLSTQTTMRWTLVWRGTATNSAGTVFNKWTISNHHFGQCLAPSSTTSTGRIYSDTTCASTWFIKAFSDGKRLITNDMQNQVAMRPSEDKNDTSFNYIVTSPNNATEQFKWEVRDCYNAQGQFVTPAF